MSETLRKIPAKAPIADIMAIYREDGGVILQGVLSPEEVATFNAELDPVVGDWKPCGETTEDPYMLAFLGSNTKRLDAVVYSDIFVKEILNKEIINDLSFAVFNEESGDYWVCSSQVIEIGPNSTAQPLHRDLEVWPSLFLPLGPAGPEACINFIIALTEFTEENGATRAIPGSHRWRDYEDRGTPEATIPVLLEPGDALFMSGKVAHGGGANVSSDQYRRGVSFGICPSMLVGEEAYPLIVGTERAKTLPKRVQKILGFTSQYPKNSPGIWQGNYGELSEFLGV
ncbi:phytanoyl-CoA dioxygenase family protein [Streptomyces antnestii]|uniref:Phytanoyl-CoA dioxygenase family protein n=1 Tax=Streptomyces antnestii TaxID=2494256 RepID=A0A437Q3C8_9ACTN|nr:phytanoyl-CoA dioxygenase family protein [Streptomyces sp. San01]RVU29026.1 phytanoyl-CoA dioxygenase family protein [Streptomyces sp. San01]